ncbi:MAG: ABC transporter ATP-binding protein [Candidatus Saccharimonadales bacterium]
MAKRKRLPLKQFVRGITDAAVLSFRIAPGAVMMKIGGGILDAVLPLLTTYFAAATTTELANAYNGDLAAGQRALVYVVIAVIIGLFSTVWSSIDSYLQSLLRYRVNAKVSDIMYEKFLALEFWRYEDKATKDTYDKAQRFANFYSYVFDQLTSVFSQLFGVIAAIVALFLFVPWIGLLVLVALAPGMYLQLKLSRAQVDLWNRNLIARRSQSNIEWNLLTPHAITELRINGLVRHLLALRATFREKDELGRLEVEKKFLAKQIMSSILETIAELASLVWITFDIIARHQPLGQFLYVQQIVSRAIGSSNAFISTLTRIDEDIAQMFQYQAFMSYDEAAARSVATIAPPDTIVFDHVSFHYHGSSKTVLHDVNLTIRRGQHIAIVGENGAGKSTLIKLLIGLYEPSKGQVLLDTIPLKDIHYDAWHQYLGLLQQTYLEYDFASLRDNVYFGDVSRPFDADRYHRALRDAEAEVFIDELKHKDQTYASKWITEEDNEDDDERGTTLSGGQSQRLALARSFYRDAPYIVLDEPTSAIDALAESRIFKRLFTRKDKTIITISHRLATVSKADVIYVMENGRIAEQGTHRELIELKGAYCRLFESQLTEPSAGQAA